jgi:hypothetical protein
MNGDAKLFLIVSIDVEEDMPNWQIEESITIRNLEGIPRLQELFVKYGVRPTYLLNYAFASNEKAVKYFSDISKKCEIGAHMHPWNTPPLTEDETIKIEYPSNLSYQRQFDKIKTVTEELARAFGSRPVSYRAGKFGFNDDTKDILARLGYLVDTSISPMVSWEDDNGPSFLEYRAQPFWMDVSGRRILEVPVTIGLNRNVSKLLEKVYLRIPKFTRIRGMLSRDYMNILDLIWLYPALFTEKEMMGLVEVMIAKGVNVFNVFFHSSEISPGESIYTKTEDDRRMYLSRLERFLDYAINGMDMRSVTLSEYRNLYQEETMVN